MEKNGMFAIIINIVWYSSYLTLFKWLGVPQAKLIAKDITSQFSVLILNWSSLIMLFKSNSQAKFEHKKIYNVCKTQQTHKIDKSYFNDINRCLVDILSLPALYRYQTLI